MSATLRPFTLPALLLLAAPAAADTLKVPADFATITEAVAAAVDGDTVSVSKGVYRENVVIAVPNLELLGKGGAVIDGGYAGRCIEVAADGVSISGFTLINGSNGVFAVGSNLSITKCTVLAAQAEGLLVESGPATLSANLVEGCNGTGILYSNVLPVEALLDRNICLRNADEGIEVSGAGVTLSRNRCEGNAGTGIDVEIELETEGPPPDLPPVLIEDNDCIGNENHGLAVLNETEAIVTISGNVLDRNRINGLFADGNGLVITKNKCRDNIASGLSLFAGASTIEKNTALRNGASGIELGSLDAIAGPADGATGTGDGNTVDANSCRFNGGDGIVVSSGAGNLLSANKCLLNRDDGLDLDEVGVTGTTLEDNVCTDNLHEGIDNTGADTLMLGNTCKQNGRGAGPDIAGLGDAGLGTLAQFEDNVFTTGGADALALYDDAFATGP